MYKHRPLSLNISRHVKKIKVQRKCTMLRKQSNKFLLETEGKCKEKDYINYKFCDIFSQVILNQKCAVSGERHSVQCNRQLSDTLANI